MPGHMKRARKPDSAGLPVVGPEENPMGSPLRAFATLPVPRHLCRGLSKAVNGYPSVLDRILGLTAPPVPRRREGVRISSA